MFYHWTNDSQSDRPGAPKVWPRHGRFWIHLREPWGVSLEWNIFSGACGVGIQFDPHESRVVMRFAFLLATLYFGLDAPSALLDRVLPGKILQGRNGPFQMTEDREVSLTMYDWSLHWSMWMHPHESDGDEPWWRRGQTPTIPRLLFGKRTHTSVDLNTASVLVSMPEGDYDATARLYVSTYGRTRSPLKRHQSRVTIDIPGGIPKPGKGENSWDCADDAVFSLTKPAETMEEGIAAVVEDVLTRRRRYGSRGWTPEPIPDHVLC